MKKKTIIIKKGTFHSKDERVAVMLTYKDLTSMFKGSSGVNVLFEEKESVSSDGELQLLEGLDYNSFIEIMNSDSEDLIRDINFIVRTDYCLKLELDLEKFDGTFTSGSLHLIKGKF